MEGVAKPIDYKLGGFPAVLVVLVFGPDVKIGLALKETHVLYIMNLCLDELLEHPVSLLLKNSIGQFCDEQTRYELMMCEEIAGPEELLILMKQKLKIRSSRRNTECSVFRVFWPHQHLCLPVLIHPHVQEKLVRSCAQLEDILDLRRRQPIFGFYRLRNTEKYLPDPVLLDNPEMLEVLLDKSVLDVGYQEGPVLKREREWVGDRKVELVDLTLISVSLISRFPFGQDVSLH